MAGGRDRQLNPGTLERAEHLSAFLEVFRTRESVHVYDDDHVKETEGSIVDQARERGTFGEKAFHRSPAIIDVGLCGLGQNPAT